MVLIHFETNDSDQASLDDCEDQDLFPENYKFMDNDSIQETVHSQLFTGLLTRLAISTSFNLQRSITH